ncbi:protein of unknown function [Streptantibioticus cattleyicolor NRRL 8057 = DSM 46488]|nr:protein of unknown function [Streptantibioticus cattleyicolor NRRL 8057 = DSM 46488]
MVRQGNGATAFRLAAAAYATRPGHAPAGPVVDPWAASVRTAGVTFASASAASGASGAARVDVGQALGGAEPFHDPLDAAQRLGGQAAEAERHRADVLVLQDVGEFVAGRGPVDVVLDLPDAGLDGVEDGLVEEDGDRHAEEVGQGAQRVHPGVGDLAGADGLDRAVRDGGVPLPGALLDQLRDLRVAVGVPPLGMDLAHQVVEYLGDRTLTGRGFLTHRRDHYSSPCGLPSSSAGALSLSTLLDEECYRGKIPSITLDGFRTVAPSIVLSRRLDVSQLRTTGGHLVY